MNSNSVSKVNLKFFFLKSNIIYLLFKKVIRLNTAFNRFIYASAKLNQGSQQPPKDAKKSPAAAAAAAAAAPAYNNQEYFAYDMYSYFDIENEMVKYRLPQPSALPKNEFTYSQLPPKPKN